MSVTMQESIISATAVIIWIHKMTIPIIDFYIWTKF